MENIKRGTKLHTVLVRENGVDKEIPIRSVLDNSKYRPIGIIRIEEEEFKYYNEKSKYLTVFNLQFSGHRKDKNYLLPKILKHGYYRKSGDEVKPILDFNNCVVGKCIEVRENVSYDKLTIDDFKDSFENIRDVDALKKVLVRKYSKSMPDLHFAEILRLGVSVTKLQIIGIDFSKSSTF